MDSPATSRWLPVTILVGIIYMVIGLVTAPLAAHASSDVGVHYWRLTAWLVSGVAFVTQIFYEELRLRSSTGASALHVALAAALGAFGLAVAALIHRHGVTGPGGYLAFLVWPVFVAIPAFVVAWFLSILIARAWRKN